MRALLFILLVVWCVVLPLRFILRDETYTHTKKTTRIAVWFFLLFLLLCLSSASIQMIDGVNYGESNFALLYDVLMRFAQ